MNTKDEVVCPGSRRGNGSDTRVVGRDLTVSRRSRLEVTEGCDGVGEGSGHVDSSRK